MKSRWKQIRKIAGLGAFIFLVVQLILAGYSISWTGFGSYTLANGDFVREKTFWDWMELLIIPLVLALGAFFLNRSERALEHQIAAERTKEDRRLADERAKLEREIAIDRQREAALQNYLDRMSELLLERKLLTTKDTKVRNVARVRTLTVLQGLDARRKGQVIKFLYESGLIIGKEKVIVDLSGADLQFVELEETELSGANFMDVNLDDSKFHAANLVNACFERASLINVDFEVATLSNASMDFANLLLAKLSNASLDNAFLFGADLGGANLSNAFLVGANLSQAHFVSIPPDIPAANLYQVDLTNADLTGARVAYEQLAEAKSLKGAIMPDGTKHD